MFRCQQCAAEFARFDLPGECPSCRTRALLRCAACGHRAPAAAFLHARACPRCRAPVAASGAGRARIPLWIGGLLALVAVGVMVAVAVAYWQTPRASGAPEPPVAVALRKELLRPAETSSPLLDFEQAEWERAVAQASAAIQAEPERAENYFQRGLAHEALLRPELAEEDFTEAIAREPRYTEAYLHRAAAYAQRGLVDQAIADLASVVRLQPNHAEAYRRRGQLYHGQGKFEQALFDFGLAIELQPQLGELYNQRGLSYLGQGQFEQAIADFTQAARLTPGLATAYRNRGLAYAKRGREEDLDRSHADFAKARALEGR